MQHGNMNVKCGSGVVSLFFRTNGMNIMAQNIGSHRIHLTDRRPSESWNQQYNNFK